MSEIKLFSVRDGLVSQLAASTMPMEKELQDVFETNLERLLHIRFVASEFSTGPVHGGRIDTLGIDDDGCPVIIEYKRSTDDNVINQGLFYLHWMMDHKGDFERLVHRMLGAQEVERIDWSNPRLICVAPDFSRYNEHAAKQINRNVELLRYRNFSQHNVIIEVVHAPRQPRTLVSDASFGLRTISQPLSSIPYQSQRIDYHLTNASGETKEIFDAARDYLARLGQDVQMKELKFYVAFKRIKNFACVEVHPKTRKVTAYLKLDPEMVPLEPGFTRDVRRIGHFGTGELEVSMKSMTDFSRARPLMQIAYQRSWTTYEAPWDWDRAPAMAI